MRPWLGIPVALALCACKPPPAPAASDAGAAALDPSDAKALLAEVDRLKDQLKDKPKTFEVLAALGNLYYENGRYLEAVDAYRQAEEQGAPVEAQAEALRKDGVKAAGTLRPQCRRSGTEYGLVQIAEAARKLEPPERLRCLEAALDMALAVRARRGNSFYLIGNPDSALAEHRKVLARSPDYPESLFFVGAILLEQSQGEKQKLAEGKKYWKRLLAVAPDSPRAPIVRETLPNADSVFAPQAAGLPPNHPQVSQGNAPAGELPQGHPPISPKAHAGPTPEQVQNMAEAAQGTERTPELEKGLDQLLAESEKALDEGKYQEARDAAVRVMPMRPTDARTAAAMGGAMRGLGRSEMAERTLSRALELDPKQPRALYEMGRLQAQRGDRQGAAEKFNALLKVDPAFARARRVEEEIAKLR